MKMMWTRGMGPGNVQEATPLIYNGVMYLPNPNDLVQALDAKTGDLLWEYQRKLPADLGKFMPVFAINRNMAIYGDKIIDTSADDYVFALDAKTGALAWETKILDYQKGAQQTSGPIIANGKIISGRGCEPEGGPDACVITAHDAKTGKEIWRTRTIPKPGEPGYDTWGNVPDEKRIHVGHVDGAELRPAAEPGLHRHVGDVTGAEVHAWRQRQAATCTTTPHWR